MRAPLAVIAAAFALGIGFFWWMRPAPALLWCGTGGIVGITVWARNRPWAANLSLMGLMVIGGLFRGWVDGQIPADSIARSLTSAAQPIRCEGFFISDVEWFRPAEAPARRQGWLKVTGIEQPAGWIPGSGQLLVRLPARGEALAYGDRMRLYGQVRGGRCSDSQSHPRNYSNLRRSKISDLTPLGRFDEAQWLWLKGACGIVTVSDAEAITRLNHREGPWIRYRRWVASFRWKLKASGRSLLGPLEAAYLEALLLGEGRGIPRELWDAFRKTGTVHVLVVSGLHVGLIGTISFLLLSILRLARTLRYLALVGILMTYCLLTGSHPPILRATIMGILLCLGRCKGVEVPALNSLGCAALLILAADPRALADASFQLSFSAVLGLLVLTPRFGRWLMAGAQGRAVWETAARGMAISCGAWTAISPVVAWHFHTVTPIALFANLLIVPWACGLILVGFLLYGVVGLSPWLALPIAASFTGMAQGLTRLVSGIALLPGASWSW